MGLVKVVNVNLVHSPKSVVLVKVVEQSIFDKVLCRFRCNVITVMELEVRSEIHVVLVMVQELLIKHRNKKSRFLKVLTQGRILE